MEEGQCGRCLFEIAEIDVVVDDESLGHAAMRERSRLLRESKRPLFPIASLLQSRGTDVECVEHRSCDLCFDLLRGKSRLQDLQVLEDADPAVERVKVVELENCCLHDSSPGKIGSSPVLSCTK